MGEPNREGAGKKKGRVTESHQPDAEEAEHVKNEVISHESCGTT